MKNKFTIIGGGVAGLCAAIRLAELGEEALLIEGGSYPSHKICGEFLSPECLPYLSEWNIHPVAIPRIVINTPSNRLAFAFPSPAGGMSHVKLDPALLDIAMQKGVQIMTNTRVTSFVPKSNSRDSHLIQLSNHETIEASNVIIAVGRFPNLSNNAPLMRYMGLKAHFKNGLCCGNDLQMFSLPGAYLGVSPIEEDKCNVACLVDLKAVGNQDPQSFIRNLISQNVKLRELFMHGENLFDQWMTASVPSFGVKQTPEWLDTYFIGDAAMTIPPACGNGLSMAIFGGRLAAEYVLKKQSREFKKMWTKRCASQMFWAKTLHKLMLNPTLNKPVVELARYFPTISRKVFELTRQPN
ncbi:MAG TPA: NAD(P)/FAD-dependent oxidoreductase [Parachlamydiaceae bacterium]|nr:NAD(P)/FAD-dependent oxidoreductase [Parachlamydiaceae bacterium]